MTDDSQGGITAIALDMHRNEPLKRLAKAATIHAIVILPSESSVKRKDNTMEFKNPITTKRINKLFADLIVDTMRHENISLLEAYVGLAHVMTSDKVVALAKAKVEELNA